MTKQELIERRDSSLKFLRTILKPGKQVYTILRKVSSSGMSRQISLVVIRDKQLIDISWHVANITETNMNANNNHIIKMGGCGMDMGFAAVYNLGSYLYPKGFKLPKGKLGRNGDTSGFDNDGGYALHQNWL